MSYTKHTWVTGETITAEKLNNIEDGIDGIDGGKQNAPVTAGTAGQVLSLDNQLNPVWADQTITDYVASIGALGTVTLGTTWTGSDPYTSTVTVTGCTVTEKTLVNILPDSAVVEQMQEDGITEIYITNNGGALTATAIGGAPTQAITLNVLCTESDFAADIDELSRHLNDKQDKTNYVNVTGTTLTLAPAVDNTMYLCGELTELTVTAPASGIFAVRFTSGTTPTVVTLNGITMPDDWTGAEASTTYEINVLNGLGVWQSWI